MGGGDKHPVTPPPKALQHPFSNGKDADSPATARGKDPEAWDPIQELGLIKVGSEQITCLGKTWYNKRCQRGPSANNNRPFRRITECSAIQGCIERLAELPVAKVATRRVDLLLDLAEAMMCLKEPDGGSEWKGHQLDQAAAQAYTWRCHLSRKAGLRRAPSVAYQGGFAPSPKRRRGGDDDDGSPSPSSKRRARPAKDETDNDDQEDDDDYDDEDDTSFHSRKSTSDNNDDDDDNHSTTFYSQTPQSSATVGRPGWPSSSPSTPSTSRYGLAIASGRKTRLAQLPAETLAHGVRTLEIFAQEQCAIIRDLQLELNDARGKAAAAAAVAKAAEKWSLRQEQEQQWEREGS